MVQLGELMMILELHRQGLSVTAIARRTGRDPKTVRKYIERGIEAPVYGPHSVGHGLCRRSSSARAKYADALRRISFAWRSSRFSRSSALIRSRSSVVGPGRTPRSHAACLTQWRSVSPEQPIFSAIERIADHCEACSLW